MFSDEIKKLHSRITDRLNRSQDEIIAASKNEDELIASMANSAGWDILKAKMDGMIAELLEPTEFSDDTPMDVRGAVGEAKWYCLKFIREIIQHVEATKSAKKSEKIEKPKEETAAGISE